MDLLVLIVQLLGGVAGGHVAASLMKGLSLGTLGNWLAGAIGGLLGGNILSSALNLGRLAEINGLDLGTIVSHLAGSGVGGGLMMVLVGMLRTVFAR